MRLSIFSSKECWRDDDGYIVTVGGFPQQIKAIAALFDGTVLKLPLERGPAPSGAVVIEGPGLTVEPLPHIPGTGLRRKLALLLWIPRVLPGLLRTIRQSHAVHTPVPGDVGGIAMLLTWALRKPLFVRHCGTWGSRNTVADTLLDAFLSRAAGKKTVVMATGGGSDSPSSNPEIAWIFATTLSDDELATLAPAELELPQQILQLVTVGRLTTGKNVDAIIGALSVLRDAGEDAHLTVVGDGPRRAALEAHAEELGLKEAVHFLGHLDHDQVLAALQRSELFIFPTRVAEGFPKAVLEAMACGLPVIATNVSVIPRLLHNADPERECGLVLESPTSESVEAAILELAADPDRMRAMGVRSRHRAREFSLEEWQRLIRQRLETAWGAPLRSDEEPNPHPTREVLAR